MRKACPTCQTHPCADWCGDEARNGFALPVDIRDGRVRTLAFHALRAGWQLARTGGRPMFADLTGPESINKTKYVLAIDLSEPGTPAQSTLLLSTFGHFERSLRGFGGAV